jgi:hypothetical protein
MPVHQEIFIAPEELRAFSSRAALLDFASMSTPFLPRAWTAADAQNDSSWILRLSPEATEGFHQALLHAKAAGKAPTAMTPDDFPLPAASRAALDEAIALTQGRWGMCLLKGLPTDRWTEDEARLANWGMGLHMGTARTQNRASAFMADVRDEGGSYKTKNGRGYNTNKSLDFHCDSCDVVALMCRRTARQGGESKVVSSIALRDEIARIRPDLIPVLQGPWYHSSQGAQGPGKPGFYMLPLLGDDPVNFAMRANRKNVVAAQRDFPEVPRLTAQQLEALDLLDTLMADPKLCFSMWLDRGDLQLLNSYVTLHSRTDFEDFDDPDLKRHLYRLWLAVPSSQRLPAQWAVYFDDVRPGAVRGGLRGDHLTQDFIDFETRQAAIHGMPLIPRHHVEAPEAAAAG